MTIAKVSQDSSCRLLGLIILKCPKEEEKGKGPVKMLVRRLRRRRFWIAASNCTVKGSVLVGLLCMVTFAPRGKKESKRQTSTLNATRGEPIAAVDETEAYSVLTGLVTADDVVIVVVALAWLAATNRQAPMIN